MKILLVDPKVKSIAPNIALMKWAHWCELNGHEYEYVKGTVIPKMQKPDYVYMSAIFTYFSKTYIKTIKHYGKVCPSAEFKVGGAFPSVFPEWWEKTFPGIEIHRGIADEIEYLPPKYSIEPTNKKIVTYASRGCPNKCGYCFVPRLEGKMKSFPSIQETLDFARKEIPDAESVVLYDNNFTAHEYFDDIVDELKAFGLPIDIHGLHVSCFTEHQAKRFAELKWGAQSKKGTAYMRFSFDFVGYAKYIRRALKYTADAKVKAGFFCYMLFNWKDTPHDFWKRMVMAQEMVDETGKTLFLFPQRFEPNDALERNKYIGKHWDEDLVRGVTRMYTFMHGFLPMTKTKNIYNWVGHTEDEFFDNARKFATVKGFKLKKKTGTVPELTY